MILFDRKPNVKFALAFLAMLLFLGSLPVSAQETGTSVSAIRPPSGIGLQDANRVRLLQEARAMYQLNEAQASSYEYGQYYDKFKKISLDAFAVAFDPASSSADLAAALQPFDTYPPYDLFAGDNNVFVDGILFEKELQLHLYTEFGSEPGLWTEANGEQWINEIATVRDRLYPLISWDYWKPEVWPIFWEFLKKEASFEDLRNGRSDIFAQTFQYRADVLNRLADGRLAPQQTASFDTAVQELTRLLAVSAQPQPIADAFAQVKTAYETLPQGGNPASALAADIEAARLLLNLPKGIRSGQYPASAFGTLRRAINEAQRALEKGSSAAQFVQAQTKLAAAVADFRSKKKP
ncbi:hypothetical protein [Saccharibacillus sacchari]|uniref:Uncharacterized protein n=1 Tax=Saccharibacillus sacchari TaxID=456493 RepID=A0ACC6PEQ2_9BACL